MEGLVRPKHLSTCRCTAPAIEPCADGPLSFGPGHLHSRGGHWHTDVAEASDVEHWKLVCKTWAQPGPGSVSLLFFRLNGGRRCLPQDLHGADSQQTVLLPYLKEGMASKCDELTQVP